MQSSTDLENILYKNVITQLKDFLFHKYKVNWQNRMFSQKVGNKLRTYKLFNNLSRKSAYKGQYNKTCFSSSI
jgi:hypothetical protein